MRLNYGNEPLNYEFIENLDYPETEVLIQFPKNPEHGDIIEELR